MARRVVSRFGNDASSSIALNGHHLINHRPQQQLHPRGRGTEHCLQATILPKLDDTQKCTHRIGLDWLAAVVLNSSR